MIRLYCAMVRLVLLTFKEILSYGFCIRLYENSFQNEVEHYGVSVSCGAEIWMKEGE